MQCLNFSTFSLGCHNVVNSRVSTWSIKDWSQLFQGVHSMKSCPLQPIQRQFSIFVQLLLIGRSRASLLSTTVRVCIEHECRETTFSACHRISSLARHQSVGRVTRQSTSRKVLLATCTFKSANVPKKEYMDSPPGEKIRDTSTSSRKNSRGPDTEDRECARDGT